MSQTSEVRMAVVKSINSSALSFLHSPTLTSMLCLSAQPSLADGRHKHLCCFSSGSCNLSRSPFLHLVRDCSRKTQQGQVLAPVRPPLPAGSPQSLRNYAASSCSVLSH